MESKELFKRTFTGQYKEGLIIFGALLLYLGGLASGAIISVVENILGGIVVASITTGVFVVMMIYISSIPKERDVNLFIGDHKWTKFVKLSLKYLGYETKILDATDGVKRDFIVLNDKYLVYTPKSSLTLGKIDIACKIAKEEDMSLTVIMDEWIMTPEAYEAVKRGGIILYYNKDIYNILYKTIKTKGGKPIRECLCT